MRKIILSISLLALLFSCVPRKKLIYIQQQQEAVAERRAKQPQTKFNYKLQAGDLIGLTVFSLTNSEYNFFSGGGGGGAPTGGAAGGGGATGAAGGGGGGGTGNSSLSFSLDEDGFVELPAVGKLRLEGLTLRESQEKIKSALDEYLKDPVVQVDLLTLFEFTILGEIGGGQGGGGGGKQLVPKIQLNILEAIAISGGLTGFADRENVRVVRELEGGKVDIIKLNLLDDNLLYDDNYYLKSGDIIIVDPLNAKNVRENQVFVLSSILGAMGGLGFLLFRIFGNRGNGN